MPKAFSGAKLNATEINSWVCYMNLYLAALNLPEHKCAVCAALNLADEVAVWLHAQDIDLATITWDALVERLHKVLAKLSPPCMGFALYTACCSLMPWR